MTILDDPLNDLFNAAANPANPANPAEARRPLTVPTTYVPVEKRFEEPCTKCRGSGNFIGYTGRAVGRCFTCDGTGKKVFKSAPEARAKGRAQAADRKARTAAQNLLDFQKREPQVFAWLNAEGLKDKPFDFATSMIKAISDYGDLTERQLETSRRLAAKVAQRQERSLHLVMEAPQVSHKGIDRLKQAFDHAIAYSAAKGRTLTYPRITIGDLTISPAKAGSANPGALYCKEGDTYLGKVAFGRFIAVAACTPEQSRKVQAFIADPKSAAEAYGIETGVCCICNATLTNKVSIERGIGPICAEKFGW